MTISNKYFLNKILVTEHGIYKHNTIYKQYTDLLIILLHPVYNKILSTICL